MSASEGLDLRSRQRSAKDAGPFEVRSGMTARERCPRCSRRLTTSRFDTTFRLPDRTERLCFGIPASLCGDCQQLWVDPDLLDLLDLGSGRCIFAIESDQVVQEQAWSSAD